MHLTYKLKIVFNIPLTGTDVPIFLSLKSRTFSSNKEVFGLNNYIFHEV